MQPLKKLLIVLQISISASLLPAQNDTLEFGAPVPLSPAAEQFQQPVWSPDASMIALAGKNYNGIWVIQPDGTSLRPISDDAGAGYRFSWSNDSRTLLWRTFRFDKGRRVNIIKMEDIETGETRIVAEFKRALFGLPRWSPDASKICVQTRRGVELLAAAGNTQQKAAPASSQSIFYNAGSELTFWDSAGQKLLGFKPVPGSYLNAALSPDGTKIAFEVLGGNLYVVNADGTGLTDLGPGERPAWAGNSLWLAYMITEDDGHQILNSDIYIIKTEGTGKQNITNTSSKVEMNPCWSPDGRSIVFDEKHTGRIYKVTQNK